MSAPNRLHHQPLQSKLSKSAPFCLILLLPPSFPEGYVSQNSCYYCAAFLFQILTLTRQKFVIQLQYPFSSLTSKINICFQELAFVEQNYVEFIGLSERKGMFFQEKLMKGRLEDSLNFTVSELRLSQNKKNCC